MAKSKCFFLKVFCDGVLVMIVTMAVMMKIVVTGNVETVMVVTRASGEWHDLWIWVFAATKTSKVTLNPII